MKICEYCGIKYEKGAYCGNCTCKIKLAREFVKTCNELKEIINYDAILKRRKMKKRGWVMNFEGVK